MTEEIVSAFIELFHRKKKPYESMYEIVKSYRTKEITTANPKHKKSKDGICLIQEKYNKISLENRMLFEFQNFDFIVYNINKCKT